MSKIVKLSVIRNNIENICPFGLNIPEACSSAGNSVVKMNVLPEQDNGKLQENFISAKEKNNIIYKKEKSNFNCVYANSILNKFKSVDCNYGELNAGDPLNKSLSNIPTRLFYGSLNGVDTYPPGTMLGNYDISINKDDENYFRNNYYGIYYSGVEASKANNNALLKESVFLFEEPMELVSEAQMLGDMIIEEAPSQAADAVVMYSEKPSEEIVLDMHSPEMQEALLAPESDDIIVHDHGAHHSMMEDGYLHEESPHIDIISVDGDLNVVLPKLPNVPGAPEDAQEEIVVEEESSEDSSKDENDARTKDKKQSKWDWESHGASGFISWIKSRLEDIPKHSGKDVAGIDRAMAYLEKLDSEISKAMRLDLDGELDANKIEEVRAEIEDGINRLDGRIEKLKKSKKIKKKSSDLTPEIVKEAQKAPGIKGIMVTVPLFISHLGRVIMNGMISGGHDAEDMFAKLSKKYKLTDREKAELIQYLEDSNMPIRRDRGYDPDEDVDPRSSDNFDWAANYKA